MVISFLLIFIVDYPAYLKKCRVIRPLVAVSLSYIGLTVDVAALLPRIHLILRDPYLRKLRHSEVSSCVLGIDWNMLYLDATHRRLHGIWLRSLLEIAVGLWLDERNAFEQMFDYNVFVFVIFIRDLQ